MIVSVAAVFIGCRAKLSKAKCKENIAEARENLMSLEVCLLTLYTRTPGGPVRPVG